MAKLIDILSKLKDSQLMESNDGTVWDAVNLRDNVSDEDREYCFNQIGIFGVDDNDMMVFPPVYKFIEPSQKTMDDLLEACDKLRSMGINCGVNNGDFPGVIFDEAQVQKLIALLSNIEVVSNA